MKIHKTKGCVGKLTRGKDAAFTRKHSIPLALRQSYTSRSADTASGTSGWRSLPRSCIGFPTMILFGGL